MLRGGVPTCCGNLTTQALAQHSYVVHVTAGLEASVLDCLLSCTRTQSDLGE